MVAWLTLIRWKNVAIVVTLLWLIRWCIVGPITGQSALPAYLYLLMTLSMGFLTAAGNIYNDLQDAPTDKVNRPNRPLPAGRISAKAAMNGFYVCAGLSIVLLVPPAWYIDQLRLLFFPAFGLLMLVKYAEDFKGRPLLGNLVISIMTGMVVIMPAFFDVLATNPAPEDAPYFQSAVLIMAIYAGFSFLTTMARELTKDLEDEAGDRAQGYRTAPVAWGPLATKLMAALALVPAWVGLISIAWYTGAQGLLLTVVASTMVILLLICTWLIVKAGTPTEFHHAARFQKATMAIGLLSMVVLALPYWL